MRDNNHQQTRTCIDTPTHTLQALKCMRKRADGRMCVCARVPIKSSVWIYTNAYMRLTTEEKVCMALRHRCIGLWTEINTHSQCTFKGVESAVSMHTNISMYTYYYAFKKPEHWIYWIYSTIHTVVHGVYVLGVFKVNIYIYTYISKGTTTKLINAPNKNQLNSVFNQTLKRIDRSTDCLIESAPHSK